MACGKKRKERELHCSARSFLNTHTHTRTHAEVMQSTIMRLARRAVIFTILMTPLRALRNTLIQRLFTNTLFASLTWSPLYRNPSSFLPVCFFRHSLSVEHQTQTHEIRIFA